MEGPKLHFFFKKKIRQPKVHLSQKKQLMQRTIGGCLIKKGQIISENRLILTL